jgi:cytochrome c oxidase assembly factor CtaG
MPRFVDPAPLVLIALVGFAYRTGTRHGARVTRRQELFFYAGLVVTAVAVASPLDTAADRSLTAHMSQHVLLLSASGPLLALGAPLPTLLWALVPDARRTTMRWSRALTRSHDRWQAAWVGGGLLVEAGVVFAWHFPVLYQAAIHHAVVHDLEHLMFVVVSTASWWTVVTGRRSRRGAAAVAALLGSLSGIILGSALVIAPHTLYSSYPSLNDQRMAGVVMWAFGGLLDDLVGAALFASWLNSNERPEESYVVPPLPGASL